MWLMGSPRRGPDGEGDGWPPARTTPAQINPRIINSTYLIEWCLLVKQTEADDTEQEGQRDRDGERDRERCKVGRRGWLLAE